MCECKLKRPKDVKTEVSCESQRKQLKGGNAS